jgi:16S rRNA (adenine1518-N6/adenine1519-N6)-dimethyltransferase
MHAPRKRFGQHFLTDTEVIARLVSAIAPERGQHLVEIGPGQGALTIPVLQKTGEMDAVELDWDLVPILQARCKSHGELHVHQADALEFDFSKLIRAQEPLRIIGNLPYNISTPLLFHLLTFAAHISDMHFMLQKEVVDRLAAKSGNGHYGRLSIMVQYHCQVTALFDVPAEAFDPPPRVDSSIVRLQPHLTVDYFAKDYRHFGELVKTAFNQRRKTLRNSLKTLMDAQDWIDSGIDSQLRPEQLSVKDYVLLSNALVEKNSTLK